jgi:uncharacterized membrane protein YecN with MAPEG domain
MLRIEFETEGETHQTFAHIWSDDGVFGHAAEVKERIPAGTWLTIPPQLSQITPWLIEKCGFKFVGRVLHEHEVVEVLIKE